MSVRLAQRAAEDGEVLGEDVDEPSIDTSVAGNDAIAGILLLLHPEIKTAMRDEFVDLFEGILVEKKRNPLSRAQLAFGFLPVQTLLAPTKLGSLIHLDELFDAGSCCDLGHKKMPLHLGRGFYLMTGTFSQSFRNCSTPLSVKGCFRS